MTSKVIRTWFASELQTRVPSIPYYKTLNSLPGVALDGKNLPDIWTTLEFSNAVEQRMCLGTPALFREFGEVLVIVVSKSGLGDDAAVDAGKLIQVAFQHVDEQVSPGTLRFEADTPNTDSTEQGNWFLASVSCSYTFDTVK